ncbi:MAG: pilus assembly protein [Catenulisporales bacterium]|nr:pilus assembly protein [Catenulisporales bacterium]
MRFRSGGDGGSATIEAVILAPVIFLLITAAVVTGRIATFHEVVQQAVQAAARAGSLSRTQGSADAAALATWTRMVTPGPDSGVPSNDIHCDPVDQSQPLAGFTTTPGTQSAIAVNGNPSGAMYIFRGTCTLQTKWLLGLFGDDITVTATAYSPVDPYRCHGKESIPC